MLGLPNRKEPRMTNLPVPQNLDEPRPAVRHDPEIAAAMVSAEAMLSLKRRVAQLETELSATVAERETWRARCDAKQELLDAVHIELNRYRGFAERMSQGFNDASGILVKIMEESRNLKKHFDSQEQTRSVQDDGEAPPAYLTERHLQETHNDNQ